MRSQKTELRSRKSEAVSQKTNYREKIVCLLSSVFCSLCSVFCLLAFLFGCQQKQVQIKIGNTPPKFTLSDLKGNKVTVPDDFKGRVVIIRFWADWCTYCAEEMPALDVVYNKYKKNGVIILAVNVGQPKEVAEEFVTNLRISYPVLLDTYSITAKQYGVVGLPTSFILDRNGVIREKILGEVERESFEKMVTALL